MVTERINQGYFLLSVSYSFAHLYLLFSSRLYHTRSSATGVLRFIFSLPQAVKSLLIIVVHKSLLPLRTRAPLLLVFLSFIIKCFVLNCVFFLLQHLAGLISSFLLHILKACVYSSGSWYKDHEKCLSWMLQFLLSWFSFPYTTVGSEVWGFYTAHSCNL